MMAPHASTCNGANDQEEEEEARRHLQCYPTYLIQSEFWVCWRIPSKETVRNGYKSRPC